MREGIGQQRLTAQDDEGAEESIGETNQGAGEERPLHEGVAEGLQERVDEGVHHGQWFSFA